MTLNPPGFSVFLGGTAEDAANKLIEAYPHPIKFSTLHELAKRVASGTVEKIKAAEFAVIRDRTKRFPNHARLIHPKGAEGFGEKALKELAKAFSEIKI
jgi:hypothetical protein